MSTAHGESIFVGYHALLYVCAEKVLTCSDEEFRWSFGRGRILGSGIYGKGDLFLGFVGCELSEFVSAINGILL